MEKKAKENGSRFRTVLGKWVAVSFSVFVIYSMTTLRIQEMRQLSLFLAFSLALAFIHYPLNPKKPNSKSFIFIDLLLACLSFTLAIYIYIDFWEFIFRVGIPTKWDSAFSFEISELEKEVGCIYFERLRLVNEEPIFYDITMLPNINLPRFTSRKFEDR